jgi:hypothetical protein
VACDYYPSNVGKCKNEDGGPCQPGQKVRLYLQITRAKRAGGMAEVVEHLPSKGKAEIKCQYHEELCSQRTIRSTPTIPTSVGDTKTVALLIKGLILPPGAGWDCTGYIMNKQPRSLLLFFQMNVLIILFIFSISIYRGCW